MVWWFRGNCTNKDRINEILEEKYRGTNEKPHVGEDNNDGTFIMCYSDFRNIFNKVCVSISFPQGTLGVRFFQDGLLLNQVVYLLMEEVLILF